MRQDDTQPDASPAAIAKTTAGLRVSVALVICGSVVLGFFSATLPPQGAFAHGGGQMRQVALLVVAGILLLAGIVMMIYHSSRRRRLLALALSNEFNRLGFTSITKPPKSERDGLFRNFAHLTFLRHGGKGLSQFASGLLDSTSIEVITHSYVVSTGKSAHTVFHTVASCECPIGWPVLTLTPESFLHRIGEAMGFRDIHLDRDSFNRAWRVKSDDEGFAVTLLSPAIQTWLETNSKHESWYIGHGRICRVQRKQLLPEQYEPFMRGLLELVSMIPDEMFAWDSGTQPQARG